MKLTLRPKLIIKGYSVLYGVHHTRIKARARKINNSVYCNTTDRIRKERGSYTSEYRLVKEPEGFIFREVLHDTGINGHHRTMKEAISHALWHVTIHIDEKFEHENETVFKKLELQHIARNNNCKHKQAFYYERLKVNRCPECGLDGF